MIEIQTTPKQADFADDLDLTQMTQQQLIAERARLQRSQAGNPQEEKWQPRLIARLEHVEAQLQEHRDVSGQNDDLEQMTLEQLTAEVARLEKSQAGNPDVQPWESSLHPRLERARALKKQRMYP